LKQRFFKIKFRVNRVHSLLINASLLKGYFLLQLTTKPSTVLLRKKTTSLRVAYADDSHLDNGIFFWWEVGIIQVKALPFPK